MSQAQSSNNPAPGSLYRHVDGGIYRVLAVATHSEDLSLVVVYEHVWPFTNKAWVRPLEEWPSRFTHITRQDLLTAMAGNREQAQEAITQHKAARRAAQGR